MEFREFRGQFTQFTRRQIGHLVCFRSKQFPSIQRRHKTFSDQYPHDRPDQGIVDEVDRIDTGVGPDRLEHLGVDELLHLVGALPFGKAGKQFRKITCLERERQGGRVYTFHKIST